MNWNLRTNAAVLCEKYVWFSNNTFNGLFRIHVENMQVEFVAPFPKESMEIKFAHRKCYVYENKLIFLPFYAEYIHIYNLLDGSFDTILIDKHRKHIFVDAIIVNNQMFVLPLYKEMGMWKINLDTLQRTEIKGFSEQCGNIVSDGEKMLTRCSYWDGKIYFAFFGKSIIASWDIEAEKLITREIDVKNMFSMCICKGDGWIISNEGMDIYLYKADGNLVKCRFDNIDKYEFEGRFYSQIFQYQEHICALPVIDTSILKYEKDRFCEIPGIEENKTDERLAKYLGYVEVGMELWILPHNTSGTYIFDKDMKFVRRVDMILTDKKEQKKVLSYLMNEKMSGQIIYESKNDLLEYYLHAVSNI